MSIHNHLEVLVMKHADLEQQLARLSPVEATEEAQLKKRKLQLKDEIERIRRSLEQQRRVA